MEKETIVSFCWGHPLLGLHLSEICVGDNDNAYAQCTSLGERFFFIIFGNGMFSLANAKEEEENIFLMASF